MKPITINIPLKITTNRTKKIAGPYTKIRHHYYLMMSLVVAGYSYRWEPHLIIDRTGSLSDEGVTSAAGPIVLLEYNGWRKFIDAAKEHGLNTVHLPRWGFPAVLLFVTETLGEEELVLLDKAGLSKVYGFLRHVKDLIRVSEV